MQVELQQYAATGLAEFNRSKLCPRGTDYARLSACLQGLARGPRRKERRGEQGTKSANNLIPHGRLFICQELLDIAVRYWFDCQELPDEGRPWSQKHRRRKRTSPTIVHSVGNPSMR